MLVLDFLTLFCLIIHDNALLQKLQFLPQYEYEQLLLILQHLISARFLLLLLKEYHNQQMLLKKVMLLHYYLDHMLQEIY